MDDLLEEERGEDIFLTSNLGQGRDYVKRLNIWSLRKARAKDSWKSYCEGGNLSLMVFLGPDCFLP